MKISKTYWQKSSKITGPALAKEFDTIGQIETRKAIEHYVLSCSSIDTKLLDAGCNTGVEGYRLFIAKYAGHYTGVDSNGKAIKIADYNLSLFPNKRLVRCSLEKLPFNNKEFDLTLNKDVIEHHRSYASILTEILRVTRHRLILSMFIQCTDLPNDIIHKHKDGYYLNSYNRQYLYSFIKKNSFELDKIIYKDRNDEVLIFKRND